MRSIMRTDIIILLHCMQFSSIVWFSFFQRLFYRGSQGEIDDRSRTHNGETVSFCLSKSSGILKLGCCIFPVILRTVHKYKTWTINFAPVFAHSSAIHANRIVVLLAVSFSSIKRNWNRTSRVAFTRSRWFKRCSEQYSSKWTNS